MKLTYSFSLFFSIPLLLIACEKKEEVTPQPEALKFKIYHTWDFENEIPGPYTNAEIREDFDVITNYDHNSGSIEESQIDGKPTKVLKITHPANRRGAGFDLDARLSADFDELYLSCNFRFSENFNSTTGGKLPGLGGSPLVTANTFPEPHIGFLCKSMFKQAGSLITYHYDRTTGKCPWASSAYKYYPIYFNNGNWYNITRRVVMNTFTNGVANADGIHEVWVDGRMIFQENNLKLMVTESESMKIDDLNIAHFYGGGSDDYMPLYECYGYIDNVKVYMPENDPVSGRLLHSPEQILQTPDEISSRTLIYDKLITAPGTLKNTEFGNTYGGCIDETYLIDAGQGKTVTFTFTSYSVNDSGDFLFFYDGNQTDSDLIKTIPGPSTGTALQIKSSGRYLFVRFSTDRDEGGAGWTGKFTFQ